MMKRTIRLAAVSFLFICLFQLSPAIAQGGRLPHLDYVPEFPYPVQIIKTSNDDTRRSRKIKYITFTTSLTPIQVKTFYCRFLRQNGWSTGVSIKNQVFAAGLVMKPKPSTTKDGRTIIYVGPLGGDDYGISLDCKPHGSGTLVDLEYDDYCYKGRPTTTTVSKKYFVPVIN